MKPARTDRSPWNWLLLVPIVLPLLTFVYNRENPKLLGFPFFFWFQCLFAPLAVLFSVAVFYRGGPSPRTPAAHLARPRKRA